ncbi:MAG: ABC transporter ATP-binding protein [Oscillospiraceae bacterium]
MATLIECKELSKNFSGHQALKNVTFTVESGKIVGLLGPNGAGKTTLIKIMANLLTQSSGEVRIGGFTPGISSKNIVSYLSDKECLPTNITAKEAVELYRDFFKDFNTQRADEMLSSLKINVNMKIKEMSKGTREKVLLILTMSRDASVYILDEPIGGVDPAAREYIINTILRAYRPEASIIISTHLVSDIENILDDVIFIRDGQIVLCDSVDHIREEKGMSLDGVFREVFRC